MSVETLLLWLAIGAIAGWIAGMLVRGGGFGLVGNIVVGIIGAFVGGWLFDYFHISTGGGIFGAITGATVGAVFSLFVISIVRRTA